MNIVDTRGMSCPQPVLMTKKTIEATGADKVTVLVDNTTALGNVTRYLKSAGFNHLETEMDGDDTRILAQK